MNIPFSRFTGFIVRFFRSFTKTITRPWAAWILVLLLATYGGLIGWSFWQYIVASAESHSLRVEYDRYLLASQEEILEKLEKVLADSGNSQ